MAEHNCLHEVDLALMCAGIKRIEKSMEEVSHILRGNGEVGLKGKAERHWVAIRALFWVNGAIAIAIIGVIIDHIFMRR